MGNIIIFKFCTQSKRHNALSRYIINSIFSSFPPDLSNAKQKIQKYWWSLKNLTQIMAESKGFQYLKVSRFIGINQVNIQMRTCCKILFYFMIPTAAKCNMQGPISQHKLNKHCLQTWNLGNVKNFKTRINIKKC